MRYNVEPVTGRDANFLFKSSLNLEGYGGHLSIVVSYNVLLSLFEHLQTIVFLHLHNSLLFLSFILHHTFLHFHSLPTLIQNNLMQEIHLSLYELLVLVSETNHMTKDLDIFFLNKYL